MACGVTNKPNEQIVDFDETDANDELAVVEYVDELYKFYKLEEVFSYPLSPTHISSFRFLVLYLFLHMKIVYAG